MIRLKRKTGASYFWLKPNCIYCCLLFLVTYAFLVDADTYNVLYGVRTKDIDVFYLLVYYISGLLFLAGTTVSKKFPSNVGLDALSELEKTYKFLIKLTFLAYGIWFARFAAIHGFHALISFYNVSYVSQKAPIFRIISGRIGGLTTMTEFGVVVAPLAMMFYLDCFFWLLYEVYFFRKGWRSLSWPCPYFAYTYLKKNIESFMNSFRLLECCLFLLFLPLKNMDVHG